MSSITTEWDMPVCKLHDGSGETLRILKIDDYIVPTFDTVSLFGIVYVLKVSKIQVTFTVYSTHSTIYLPITYPDLNSSSNSTNWH